MDNAFFAFIVSCVTAMAVENAVFAYGLGLRREVIFLSGRRQALVLGGLFTWMAVLTALFVEGGRLLLERDIGLLVPRLCVGFAAIGLIMAAALRLSYRAHAPGERAPFEQTGKVCFFSALGALFAALVYCLLWLSATVNVIVWPVALLATVLLVLTGTYQLSRLFGRAAAAQTSKTLPVAALNTALFYALLHTAAQSLSFARAMGYALGAGLGYVAALLIVLYARKRLAISPVPRSFRGLPILLVYLGLVSLALYGLRYINY